MKNPIALLCALALTTAALADSPTVTVPSIAASPAPVAGQPTKESIDKLLEVMDVKNLITNMQARVNAAVKAGMQATLRGQVVTPDQQKIVDDLGKHVATVVDSQLSWENMRPLYSQVYAETFTQQEIDGLTAFYQSPTGKVFVSKVPQVMDKTTALMQTRLQPLMRELQATIAQSAKQIQDLSPKPSPAPLAPLATPIAAPKS